MVTQLSFDQVLSFWFLLMETPRQNIVTATSATRLSNPLASQRQQRKGLLQQELLLAETCKAIDSTGIW